jgi:hypothetical protein
LRLPALGAGVRHGLAGGAVAAALLLLPAIAGARPGALAQYGATLAALLAVLSGMRAIAAGAGGATFARLIAGAALIAGTLSASVGAALYVLYAHLAPHFLAERYAARLAGLGTRLPGDGAAAQELARLTARQAQQLDPAFQAFFGAVTTLFLAMLLGAYLAWRARLSARLRAGRSSPRR